MEKCTQWTARKKKEKRERQNERKKVSENVRMCLSLRGKKLQAICLIRQAWI